MIKNKSQNDLIYYLSILLYMFLAVIIRVFAFSPLYYTYLTGNYTFPIILCVCFILFLVLPLRFSFAQAIVNEQGNRYFSLKKAFSFNQYTKKLVASWVHALQVGKWLIPLIALLYSWIQWYNVTLTSDAIAHIDKIGRQFTDFTTATRQFVLTLFGSDTILVSNGGLIEGVTILLSLVLICVIFFLIGCYRNSHYRYLWCIAMQNGVSSYKFPRKFVKKYRGAQFRYGLLNFFLWIPFLVTLTSFFTELPQKIVDSFLIIYQNPTFSSLPVVHTVYYYLLLSILSYFCILPIRRAVSVRYITKTLEKASQEI